MNSRLIPCLFFLIIVSSCAPEFALNTRVLAKGVLTDGDGNSLPNKEVSIYIRSFPGFSENSQSQYLLGRNISNDDGSFEVVSLLAYEEDFYIAVNGNDEYVDYVHQTRILDEVPTNLTFDLGAVVLKKRATVNFNIIRVSSPGTSITYSISYQNPSCFEFFEDGVLVPEMSDCYTGNFTNGSLNDDNPNSSRHLNTTVGSILTFTYSINGQPEVTETFIIDQPNFSYEFTY